MSEIPNRTFFAYEMMTQPRLPVVFFVSRAVHVVYRITGFMWRTSSCAECQ